MTLSTKMRTDDGDGPPYHEDPFYENLPPQWYSGFDSAPTAEVCEAVYLDPSLRLRVFEAFEHQRHCSWAPNHLLDTTAALRHAGRARRWQLGRDALFCAVLVGFVGAAVAGLLAAHPLPLVTVAAVLVVGGPVARRVLQWRAVTAKSIRSWLWRRLKRKPKEFTLALITATALTLALGSVAVRQIGAIDICLLSGGIVLIVAIGIADAAVVTRWALDCRNLGSIFKGNTPLLRERAPRLSVAAEKRVNEIEGGPEPDQAHVDEGMVIVYNLDERIGTSFIHNVFVGSGESLGSNEINIDIARGKLNGDGTRETPKPVRMPALHRTIEHVARQKAEPGYWCGYRMYVDDRTLFSDFSSSLNAHLMPDPHAGPRSRLPLDLHRRYLHTPTAYQQTHLCLQAPVARFNGEIVVTLILRGDLTASVLTVHSDILLLPGPNLSEFPNGYPTNDRWTFFAFVLRAGTLEVWRKFLLSPARLVRDAGASIRRRTYHVRIRRGIKHRRQLRYGSGCSIREELARGSRIVHPNARKGISQTVANLMHIMQAGLRQYLEDCNIDTTRLDDDVRTVINNHNNRIGELHAKNVTFGDNSPAGDTNHGSNQGHNPPPAQN
jgi:hypothetical protein